MYVSLALYMLSEREHMGKRGSKVGAREAMLLHFDMSYMRRSILALVEVFTHCIQLALLVVYLNNVN